MRELFLIVLVCMDSKRTHCTDEATIQSGPNIALHATEAILKAKLEEALEEFHEGDLNAVCKYLLRPNRVD